MKVVLITVPGLNNHIYIYIRYHNKRHLTKEQWVKKVQSIFLSVRFLVLSLGAVPSKTMTKKPLWITFAFNLNLSRNQAEPWSEGVLSCQHQHALVSATTTYRSRQRKIKETSEIYQPAISDYQPPQFHSSLPPFIRHPSFLFLFRCDINFIPFCLFLSPHSKLNHSY